MENHKYLEHVEKIIESKSFGRSNTYANLLRYLVQCTIEGSIPKETTIAAEIFGKSSFDPSQSTLIRVYIYNLRKKLQTYYENEGDNDTIKVKIPKGGYKVSFEAIDETKPPNLQIGKRFILIALATILITALLVGLVFNSSESEKNISNISLWLDLFKNDKTTMLVLGDLFVYSEIDTISGLNRSIRDPNINSEEEYDAFRATDTRVGTINELLTYSLLIRNSALWIKDLSRVFYEAEEDFVIRSMSRFNPKELSENDFIVVGMIKTLGIFQEYFEKLGYNLDPVVDNLYVTGSKHNIDGVYTTSGEADTYHTDYAVMAKVPGPNNNFIYLFGGIWDTGTSQSLKHFTDPKLTEELYILMESKFGEIPKYYKIFIEVNGIDRMELNSRILSIEKIESETTSLNIN